MDDKAVVRQATVQDLDALTPLFDAYRVFYRKASDPGGARSFLWDRFSNLESVVFLAEVKGKAVGFTQLYPSFSSGSMARILVLNDLYVAPEERGKGAGRALLAAAAEYGRTTGALRLTLQTELTNARAQQLYEANGWKRDEVFCSYTLELGS
jgi:GNAT superfamily N-acetyltransferase